MENKDIDTSGVDRQFKPNRAGIYASIACAACIGTLGIVNFLSGERSSPTPTPTMDIEEGYGKIVDERARKAKEAYREAFLERYSNAIDAVEEYHKKGFRERWKGIEQVADRRLKGEISQKEYTFNMILSRERYMEDGNMMWVGVEDVYLSMLVEADRHRNGDSLSRGRRTLKALQSGDDIIHEQDAQSRYNGILEASKKDHQNGLTQRWSEIEQASDHRSKGEISPEEWNSVSQTAEDGHIKAFQKIWEDRIRAAKVQFGEGLQNLWED